MTDATGTALVITAITTGVATVLTAVGGFILAVRQNQTNKKVDEYHGEVNHKLDAYMKLARSSAHAEGVLEGQAKPVPLIPPTK